MEMNAIEIIIGVVSLLSGLYYYLIKNYNFWTSREVEGPEPSPVFGNMRDVMLSRCALPIHLKNLYDQYPDAPMIGIYKWRNPVLILKNIDLIKDVLIKDFESFMNRDIEINEKHEPLSAHLLFLKAERWRPLRKKITPVFTSGKLRGMFHLLIECANELDTYLDQFDGKPVDMRDITTKFAIDVIGVCAFGLQANALADENSIFRHMGKRIFSMRLKNLLKFRVRTNFPGLYNLIGGFLVDHDVTKFFLDLTKNTVAYRKNNNVKRDDFIDLLMAIKDEPIEDGGIELTDSLMAAQLFVFFVASFGSSSSTMSNCLFELAMNHEIRDKLRNEIKDQLKTTDGEMTYEGINKMKYLDDVVNETLRKYPPGPVLSRQTTKPYTFSGTNVSIPVGTKIWLPIFAIQHDPKYYPNPDEFDPGRFSEIEYESSPHFSFLPFGAGPRSCIGSRFGRMQTKVGLIKILQNYSVDVCDETDKNYELSTRSTLLVPKNGIILKLNRIPI